MSCVCTLIVKLVTGFENCCFVDVEMVYERFEFKVVG